LSNRIESTSVRRYPSLAKRLEPPGGFEPPTY
jgi:hypothetical protein